LIQRRVSSSGLAAQADQLNHETLASDETQDDSALVLSVLKSIPGFASFLAWTISAFGIFVGTSSGLLLLGQAFDSGPFGICGSYGPIGGYLLVAELLSVPFSITAGVLIARRFHRYLRKATP
jgi:hypothetical protein